MSQQIEDPVVSRPTHRTPRQCVALLLVASLATLTTAYRSAPTAPPPTGIAFEDQRTVNIFDETLEMDFYRNADFTCGRSGEFSFLVLEPRGAPGSEAPLWVYLHGGGVGYYDENGVYVGVESYNDEEDFDTLFERGIRSNLFTPRGIKNTTVAARVDEGYRVLVPSLCDHDLYSGQGGRDYPNNPNYGPDGDSVDGLDANKAALKYTVENYPTTNVFVHGTSAGSVGAFALAHQLHTEGIDLNGAIMDSYVITKRLDPLFEAGVLPQSRRPGFDPAKVTEKVGPYADPDGPLIPEAQVAAGFDAVPLMDIAGESDPLCAGQLAPVAEAVADAAGTEPPQEPNNCRHVHHGFALAVADQANSPHEARFVPLGGHSPTKRNGGVAHDWVSTFVNDILSSNPPHPFATPRPKPDAARGPSSAENPPAGDTPSSTDDQPVADNPSSSDVAPATDKPPIADEPPSSNPLGPVPPPAKPLVARFTG